MWNKQTARLCPPLPLPPPAQPDSPGLREAKAARQSSTEGLLAAIERGPEVRATVGRIEDHGRRNHFFELLDVTLPPRGEPT